MPTLVLEHVARDFTDGRQVRRVLFPTDLELASGELTVLAGPSGSGKTTLLSIIGLVLRPTEGRVLLGDRDLSRLSEDAAAGVRLREYGFVFQQPMLIEGLSILENVLLSVAVQGGRPSKAMRTRAMELLAALGFGRDGRPAAASAFRRHEAASVDRPRLAQKPLRPAVR
jgi:ABC-type lipoprotein export system ATPase subunit